MTEFKIFLSGSVQKQFKELNKGKSYWESEDENYLKSNLLFKIKLLNPNTITIDKNNSEGRFNEDLKMLLDSDLIIADVKDKKGIGIGSEMLLAKIYKILVYSICPPNSHYRKNISENEEWIHPFIYELSDKIFDSKKDLVFYLNELFEIGKIPNKSEIDIMRKLKCEDSKYDLVVLTGSLHCLSTLSEVLDVIKTVKSSTKIGGYNVVVVNYSCNSPT